MQLGEILAIVSLGLAIVVAFLKARGIRCFLRICAGTKPELPPWCNALKGLIARELKSCYLGAT
jgi:hypothetical protein